jgi:hypothetical protein
MSFQRNGGGTLGRYALVPNPETERLVIDAIRRYGDVLQEGERVNVAAFVRLVCERIPADEPLRLEYVLALKCMTESPAEQDIGAGPLNYGQTRRFDRLTGDELIAPAGQALMPPQHH